MVVREHNIYGVPCKDYTTWTLSLTLTLTHSACVTSRRWLAIFIVLWETVSVLVEFINQHRRQWILTVWRSVTVCWCLCSSVMFWSILHVPVCCVLSVCHRLHNLCLLSRSCWVGGAKLRWIMCFSILCHDMLINAVLFMNFSCCIESCFSHFLWAYLLFFQSAQWLFSMFICVQGFVFLCTLFRGKLPSEVDTLFLQIVSKLETYGLDEHSVVVRHRNYWTLFWFVFLSIMLTSFPRWKVLTKTLCLGNDICCVGHS